MTRKTLEEKTQDYWTICQVWRLKKGNMLVCEANALLRGIRETTGPHRLLTRLAAELNVDIIHNQSDKSKPVVRSNP